MSQHPSRRTLPLPALAGLVIVYLVLLAVVHRVATASVDGLDYGSFPDGGVVLRAVVIPVGLSVVLCAVVIQLLGWWAPVLGGDAPVQRWIRIVPILLVAAIVLGIDYGTLADKGIGFTLVLLSGAALIGLGEELMFRGIVVVALRDAGHRESRVTLWSAVAFGAAHTVNFFVDGGGHVLQIATTLVMGWFLYLVRRLTGGLLVPVVIHALWDFGLFSGIVTSEPYPGAFLFILAQVVLAVVVIRRRSQVELAGQS